MKPVSRISVFVLAFVFSGIFFTACSRDQSAEVKNYNNGIVQIQKDMFSKAQETSKVFETPGQDPQKILEALQNIQSGISKSHQDFAAMKVPAGAEKLSEAMEKFFQVEIHGIDQVILGVQYLQEHQNASDAKKVFTDAFTQFSSQENVALRDFYATQQEVASQYGQKVIDVQQ